MEIDSDLLERVEDASCVAEFDAVVGDGLQDTGEDVEELCPVSVDGVSGDAHGELSASLAPGAARLAEGAARWVMVVAEGLAAEGR